MHSVGWNNWLNDPPTVINAIYSLLTLIIASAAILQLVAYRHFFRRQLRAYVNLESVSLQDGASAAPLFPVRANTPWVFATIKNSGSTPASNVLHVMHIDVRPLDEEHLISSPDKLEDRSRAQMSVGGILTKGQWFNRQLSQDEISDINAARRAIFVYGRVQYEDAFGKRHATRYKLKYVGLYPPLGDANLTFCDAGNVID